MNTTLRNAGEIGNRRKESLSIRLKSITFDNQLTVPRSSSWQLVIITVQVVR